MKNFQLRPFTLPRTRVVPEITQAFQIVQENFRRIRNMIVAICDRIDTLEASLSERIRALERAQQLRPRPTQARPQPTAPAEPERTYFHTLE